MLTPEEHIHHHLLGMAVEGWWIIQNWYVWLAKNVTGEWFQLKKMHRQELRDHRAVADAWPNTLRKIAMGFLR